MEFGEASGLAVSADYDKRIADQRYYDQQFKRARAENMAELKAFEDDLDYMNASNSFDHELIKGEANKTIREIGEVIRNNQDWRYNPDVRRIINEKKKYLKSNQNVIRGMASDAEYKEYLKDMKEVAKNPALHDTESYDNVGKEWENYNLYGNQLGKEAAQKEGFKAFVYKKPADFINLSEEGLTIGGKIQKRDIIELGNGGFKEDVSDNTLLPYAQDLYNRRKRQIDVTYRPKTQQEGVDIAKEIIRSGIKLGFKLPEVNMGLQTEMAKQRWERQKMELGNAQAQGMDAYKQAVLGMKENYIEPGAVSEMIGITPEARIYDAEGVFRGTTAGRKFIPNGSFQQANDIRMGKDGKFGLASNKPVGVAHGYVEMSEQDLDESGYLKDPKMEDRIIKMTTEDAKGNPKVVYRIPTQVHFDLYDQSKQVKFNAYIGMTNKQITELNPLQQQGSINKPRTVVQNGITYTLNPRTGKYE